MSKALKFLFIGLACGAVGAVLGLLLVGLLAIWSEATNDWSLRSQVVERDSYIIWGMASVGVLWFLYQQYSDLKFRNTPAGQKREQERRQRETLEQKAAAVRDAVEVRIAEAEDRKIADKIVRILKDSTSRDLGKGVKVGKIIRQQSWTEGGLSLDPDGAGGFSVEDDTVHRSSETTVGVNVVVNGKEVFEQVNESSAGLEYLWRVKKYIPGDWEQVLDDTIATDLASRPTAISKAAADLDAEKAKAKRSFGIDSSD